MAIAEGKLAAQGNLAQAAAHRHALKGGPGAACVAPGGVDLPSGIQVDLDPSFGLLGQVEDCSPSEVIAALFELEMLGLIRQLPGRNFVKVW